LLCLCACGEPQVAQKNMPAPAADTATPIAAAITPPAINSPTPAPTAVPEPTTLPIEDPRDFLVGYWADVDSGNINQYAYAEYYDEELDDYEEYYILSPYESYTRYAFYPDGQFLRAIPQSERGYPIYEYGTWQFSENYDVVTLYISERYVCGADKIYLQSKVKLQESLPVSIGIEYAFYATGFYGYTSQDRIEISGTAFFRSNSAWDFMNDFGYATTGEMYHVSGWDSDADTAAYSGVYGLLTVYFEGMLSVSSWRIWVSSGTYSLIAQWNTYATTEMMQAFPIPFSFSKPEVNEPGQIRFTGVATFHSSFSFHISDMQN